jgi:hypothetical protein
MASSRLELQSLLKEITENVYFQPPNSIQIQYPCIMYERDGSELEHADNRLYRHIKRYQVTVIDRNPDSELSDRVIALPLCSFDRYFVADDLNHYVHTLFF